MRGEEVYGIVGIGFPTNSAKWREMNYGGYLGEVVVGLRIW